MTDPTRELAFQSDVIAQLVAAQLDKADPNAADQTMRTFGTLGVLRHELRDRGTRFFLCQFKPEHDLITVSQGSTNRTCVWKRRRAPTV